MKLYAWISDAHDGQPEPYPLAFEHPTLGTLALFSTRRAVAESEGMRTIAEHHAREHKCGVRLVEAEVVDTLDWIEGEGRQQ